MSNVPIDNSDRGPLTLDTFATNRAQYWASIGRRGQTDTKVYRTGFWAGFKEACRWMGVQPDDVLNKKEATP